MIIGENYLIRYISKNSYETTKSSFRKTCIYERLEITKGEWSRTANFYIALHEKLQSGSTRTLRLQRRIKEKEYTRYDLDYPYEMQMLKQLQFVER